MHAVQPVSMSNTEFYTLQNQTLNKKYYSIFSIAYLNKKKSY